MVKYIIINNLLIRESDLNFLTFKLNISEMYAKSVHNIVDCLYLMGISYLEYDA